MFGQADHRVARGLGPGAGGGRQRDEGRAPPSAADQAHDLKMVHDAARRQDQRRQRLAMSSAAPPPAPPPIWRPSPAVASSAASSIGNVGSAGQAMVRDLAPALTQCINHPGARRIGAMDQHAAPIARISVGAFCASFRPKTTRPGRANCKGWQGHLAAPGKNRAQAAPAPENRSSGFRFQNFLKFEDIRIGLKRMLARSSGSPKLIPTSKEQPLALSIRQNEILDLARRGRVLVDDLAHRFDVTLQTIRRDLGEMAEAGLLDRVHGGAVPRGHR